MLVICWSRSFAGENKPDRKQSQGVIYCQPWLIMQGQVLSLEIRRERIHKGIEGGAALEPTSMAQGQNSLVSPLVP